MTVGARSCQAPRALYPGGLLCPRSPCVAYGGPSCWNSRGQLTRPESGATRATGLERVPSPSTPTAGVQRDGNLLVSERRSPSPLYVLSKHAQRPPSARCLGRKLQRRALLFSKMLVSNFPDALRVPPRCCVCLEGSPGGPEAGWRFGTWGSRNPYEPHSNAAW